MLCPSCQQNCRDTAVLCIHCGATLSTASASDAEKPTWDIAGAALHDVAEPAPVAEIEPQEEALPPEDYRQVAYLKSDPSPEPSVAAQPIPPPPSPSVEATKTPSRTTVIWAVVAIIAVIAYRSGNDESSAPAPAELPAEAPAAVATDAEVAEPAAPTEEAAAVEESPVVMEGAAGEDNTTSAGSGLYLDVTNATSYVIGRIYVSPVSATSWGEDKLGTQVLPQGNTIRIPLGEYTEVSFDVMLCDSDGDAYKYPAFDVSKGDIVARDGDLDGKCT